MCGIATFTMLVSSSSSTDASDTVIAMMYLKRYRSDAAIGSGNAAAVIRLVRLDRREDAHPGAQRVRRVDRVVEMNANRNPLHDLRVIARRVVGRQQRELRARRRRQALDMAAEMAALVRIDGDVRR